MGKLQVFTIQLENPSGVYYGGQTVNGRVLVVLNEPMKMRAVRLKLHGEAYTYWTEHRTRTTYVNGRSQTHSYTETYTETEVYIDTEATLWGNQRGVGDDLVMAPGSYQFPFSFILPAYCPSSFEGVYGHIRYVCKANIDKPWKFDDTTKIGLTVLALVDLNTTPTAAIPITGEQLKTLGCCCCKCGTINCTARLPRSGFVPGEVIPIDMDVYNNSSESVCDVTVTMTEHVQFFARGSAKNKVRTIATIQKGEIAPGETQTWKSEGLLVPAVAPSLTNCRLIRIAYILTFSANPSGMHTDLSFELPIIIGNVPLRSVIQEMQSNYQRSNSGTDNPPSAPPMLPTTHAEYPDLPPPSYQDAVFGGTDMKEEGENENAMGDTNFAPRYPYYNWMSAPPSAPPVTKSANDD